MSFEAFNSVGGYTVGIPPTPVINENGIATLTGLQVAGISNLGSINNVILLLYYYSEFGIHDVDFYC